jgi:glycosyltransferase involved in cell wall biosynthesis
MLERRATEIDLFIAKSQFSRDKHREFGFGPDMEVVPYFLPDIDASEDHAQHDRPYFLFVGRLEKIKGLQDVIPLLERYEKADLVIIGDGEYRADLERLAGGKPRVIFKGRMAPDELNAWYRGAIGLIVPSVCYETFGIILIESFRLGTPVIARRLGPFPEIVETSGGGKLFSTEDELCAAMEALQANAESREAQALSARSSFETIWSEEPVMAAYGRALAGAAQRSGKRDLAARLSAGLFERGAVEADAD